MISKRPRTTSASQWILPELFLKSLSKTPGATRSETWWFRHETSTQRKGRIDIGSDCRDGGHCYSFGRFCNGALFHNGKCPERGRARPARPHQEGTGW